MPRFSEGDLVRVDIPDESDPDHGRYHDRPATVRDVSEDDLSEITGDPRDDVRYHVEFKDGDTMSFRWRDLRPRE